MTAEVVTDRAFTPSQLENQRLFRVGPVALPEQPGDQAKRIRNKFIIFTAATAADLGEGGIGERVLGNFKSRMVDDRSLRQGDPAAVRKSSIFGGIQFIEDVVSDEAYVVGMNAILRGMTGLEDVTYPSATSRFVSNWANLGSYAFGKFGELPFWKKPWNFVNAVNVEAAIGLLEEAPLGLGNAAAWMHKKADNVLKNEVIQFLNVAAVAVTTGYHIEKNMVQPERVKAASSRTA